MINVLENDVLKIEVNALGAELSSMMMKEDGTEYLWQGDPASWKRKAPVLFPIVGGLKDNEYYVDDKRYGLSQHGFARDMVFTLKEQSNQSLVYELMYSEETLTKYPYRFVLTIGYTLEGNNLHIGYQVKNLDTDTIYFSIGAHPGFNVPLEQGETLEDYYVAFDQPETVSRYALTANNTVGIKCIPFLQEEQQFHLTQDIFHEGAIILLDLVSNKLALRSNKSDKAIIIAYEGFPYMGIWGMPHRSPFVCLEPWYGVADFDDTDKQYKTKKGIQNLEVGEEFSARYTMTIE
ncbi:aldose 1-epimerase family protein [Vallitalea pronyensis]|uniref:Aldose 1-epimerase family protein n=1 Tax=Vallitalea pronyensis TaxID=1348613 RepID=A0A8J8SGL4_9FIRM|nr:aldose 1-epimerase family protein [Vallitalea pronyensis]QUI22482.1 aldose 1-epimerase family protein [Vallitalea pronyensis]